ncbi:amidase [Rubellimicrobium aerolatum]|uniref:Amidase n=1 Tax=Rubellimicrobium aerolatum TaxID=490979 RepID=A0ABW0SAG4_9RHOB|nr:amidase family protein [Rubellimicrobium aerolatum]MBP1805304.1 aspartyl-tRNA(Asn)/glutamyl-tRNA(Gln) amidotransferase subunit A [Rubellimicrobium aerolatum]
MEWGTITADDLGRAIAAGRADPLEGTEALLDAIARHPFRDRIYARATPERARAEARAARDRARAGLRRGPLDGVPLSWKDLFDSAGVATEAGTPLLAGRVPAGDSAVLRAATLAGTVCLGKTHMTEFAFSGLGLNPGTATPPNRHDPDRLAGGSSSGAAASLAYGLAVGAVGSDTGGSVRLPAAWNDLVGFKPAQGALPLEGVVPLCPSFDTVGPLARSVEDAALIWEALGGPRVDLSGAGLTGARIAVLRTVVGDGLEDAPARALAEGVEALGRAGATVEELDLPDLPRAYELGAVLYAAEAWASWRAVVAPAPDRVFPPVLARLSAGREVLAADYLDGMAELGRIRARAWAAIAPFDAILCATAPILPPRADAMAADHELFRATNLMALRNTRMANLLGLASISIPSAQPSCGLMLSARPGHEGQVLRLAQAALRITA